MNPCPVMTTTRVKRLEQRPSVKSPRCRHVVWLADVARSSLQRISLAACLCFSEARRYSRCPLHELALSQTLTGPLNPESPNLKNTDRRRNRHIASQKQINSYDCQVSICNIHRRHPQNIKNLRRVTSVMSSWQNLLQKTSRSRAGM